jgi:hypothetical protein
MMDDRQNEMWDAIIEGCPTVEDAVRFFVTYCGLQILDDEMYEYLRRIEWIYEEDEDDE